MTNQHFLRTISIPALLVACVGSASATSSAPAPVASILLQYSAVEVISYAIMAFLLSRSIGHGIEARRLARRTRIVQAGLGNAVKHMRDGGSPVSGIVTAREAATGLAMAKVFGAWLRYRDPVLFKERIEEAIDEDFGSLYGRCEQSELVAPRWGLALTSVGFVLALATSISDTGTLGSIDFRHIALAMASTAGGVIVANIERSTLAFHVMPIVDGLRTAAIAVLIEANCSDAGYGNPDEVRNAA